MRDSVLAKSDGNGLIQAMPLVKGKVNLTSTAGAQVTNLVYCVVDGGFTITWDDDTTSDIAAIEGNTFSIIGAKSVAITSGTFHLG